MATPDQAAAEYAKALMDLNDYNKPQIKFLTMLAEDHVQYAPEIVCIIEAHIQKVKPNQKLPAIYLIDSIVKDLPQSSYKSLLMKNIVQTFTSVFEKVDQKARTALYKVRRTWVGVFPNSKLYSIDVQINSHLDPAWPIKATPPEQGSSHVLQSKRQPVEAKVTEVDDNEEEDSLKQQEDKMRQEIIAKQQELLKLKQQTIDLELIAAKKTLKTNMSSQPHISRIQQLEEARLPPVSLTLPTTSQTGQHTTSQTGQHITSQTGQHTTSQTGQHTTSQTGQSIKMDHRMARDPHLVRGKHRLTKHDGVLPINNPDMVPYNTAPLFDSSSQHPNVSQVGRIPMKRDLDDLESSNRGDDTPFKKIKLEIPTIPMKGANIVSNILDDVSDLFGREDQDYRSGQTHCPTSDVDKMGSLLLQSPSSKGWDIFKESYSEYYAYDSKLKRQHQEAQDTECRSHMSTTDFQDGIVPTNVPSFNQHRAKSFRPVVDRKLRRHGSFDVRDWLDLPPNRHPPGKSLHQGLDFDERSTNARGPLHDVNERDQRVYNKRGFLLDLPPAQRGQPGKMVPHEDLRIWPGVPYDDRMGFEDVPSYRTRSHDVRREPLQEKPGVSGVLPYGPYYMPGRKSPALERDDLLCRNGLPQPHDGMADRQERKGSPPQHPGPFGKKGSYLVRTPGSQPLIGLQFIPPNLDNIQPQPGPHISQGMFPAQGPPEPNSMLPQYYTCLQPGLGRNGLPQPHGGMADRQEKRCSPPQHPGPFGKNGSYLVRPPGSQNLIGPQFRPPSMDSIQPQLGPHISQGMFPAQGPPEPNSMLPQYYPCLQPGLGNLRGPHGMPPTSIAMGPAMQGSLSLMGPRTFQTSLLCPGPRLMTSPLQQMWPQLSPLASLPVLVPPAVHPIPAQSTVDVSSLFSKLVAAGILTSTSSKEPIKMEMATKTEMKEEQSITVTKKMEKEKIPDMRDLNLAKLKIYHKAVIDQLYNGNKCSSCDIHFAQKEIDQYWEHLDWHFQQNKKDKKEDKVKECQNYFIGLQEWCQFEEEGNTEETAHSTIFEQMLGPTPAPEQTCGNNTNDSSD